MEEEQSAEDVQKEADLAQAAGEGEDVACVHSSGPGSSGGGSPRSRFMGEALRSASAFWGNMARFRPSFLGGREEDNLPDHLGPVKQLYCRTGHNLAVFPAGTVYGTREPYNRYGDGAEDTTGDLQEEDDNRDTEEEGVVLGTEEPFHQNAILELSSPDIGEVRIKGAETGLYVCMDAEGNVYAKNDRLAEDGIFYELYEGGYNMYMSKMNKEKGWYLGIKKSGAPKPGPRTARGQKAVQFMPRAARQPT